MKSRDYRDDNNKKNKNIINTNILERKTDNSKSIRIYEEDYNFIDFLSIWKKDTMVSLINSMLKEYKESHPEEVEKYKAFQEFQK